MRHPMTVVSMIEVELQKLALLLGCLWVCAVLRWGRRLFAFVVALVVVILAAGCGPQRDLVRPVEPTKHRPLALACDPTCTAPCVRPWPQWTFPADDPRAWDALGQQVIAPLRQNVLTCDEARAACVACIRNAEARGAICLGRSCDDG